MSVLIQEGPEGERTKRALIDSLGKLRRDFEEGNKIRNNLDEVIDKIVEMAIDECPKDTGTLASTIKAIDGSLGGIFGGGIKSLTVFNKTIMAGDVTKINPKTGKPCDYASLVHDGHTTKSGGFWGGIPFLTNAMMAYEDEIEAAIDRALKEMGRKSGFE